MENLDILEKLGKVAGIAGIAVGALVLIFSGIIQKNIFPNMTKEQGFRIIRMMIVAASMLAVVGIAAWIYTEYQKNKADKNSTLITKNLKGSIVNEGGLGIASVKIYAVQKPEIADKSDSDGMYVLPLEGNGQGYYDIVFEHPQFQTIRKKVTVDFESDDKEVFLDQVVLKSSYPPDPAINPEASNGNSHTSPQQINGNNQPNTTAITIKYAGDTYGCVLNVNINVGGRSINPQSNTVVLSNVPTGDQSYSISGMINCSIGGCSASGSDVINVTPGGVYYLMWLNENLDEYCDIGLITQDQYNLLNATF